MHTIDGKEFITHKHLEKEIYDELYVHEGRINIVQLQSLLNIDISHIESKVGDIVKNDSNLNLILGQIISKYGLASIIYNLFIFIYLLFYFRDYMNKISEEINELLQEKGSVTLSELTNSYELPTDFMQQVYLILYITKLNFNMIIISFQKYI